MHIKEFKLTLDSVEEIILRLFQFIFIFIEHFLI